MDNSDENSLLVLNDDLVWQILLRLPTKSLMRFKCVSKEWNKIIRDPLFSKSHIGGFHGLLVTYNPGLSKRRQPNELDLFNTGYFDSHNIKLENVKICCSSVLIDEEDINNGYSYNVTNKLNGLFGLYTGCSFKLCNIATHEVLDLTIISEEEMRELLGIPIRSPQATNHYYIGFQRGVYKVLRFYYYIIRKKGEECCHSRRVHLQICTLGGGGNDLEWRSLDIVPRLNRNPSSMQKICIKGIIYMKYNNYLILAIDLNTETTSEINLPSPYFEDVYLEFELVQLGGSLALIILSSKMVPEIGSIWILRDDGAWIKSRSVDLMGIHNLNYVGTLPTGEIVLSKEYYYPLPIYKYDHIQNKLLKWVEVRNPLLNGCVIDFQDICYHKDNIVPLDSLIIRSSGSSTACRLLRA